MAILEALRLYSPSFGGNLIVESDSSNAISWISLGEGPSKLQFLFSKNKSPSSSIQVCFKHVRRLANAMADSLGKEGVDRVLG